MSLLSFFPGLSRTSASTKLMLVMSFVAAALMFSCAVNAGILDDSTSMDTTPIEIELAGSRYRIPRNYLFQAENWKGGPQELVSIRVVYPGFKPFRPDTKDCMLRLNKARCRVYDVVILNKFPASEEGFDNLQKLFRKPYPKQGPYGYEVFEIGPEEARTEYYRQTSDRGQMIFDCDLNKKTEIDAICHHVAHASTGAALSYFFMRNGGLSDAAEVDLGLRNLIDSFYIGKSK